MADSRHHRGFTLVEILVVIGVIAVLASMVVAITLRVENQSKEQTVANVFAVLKGALREYYEFSDKFPAQPERNSANATAHMELLVAALEQVPASREMLKGISGELVKNNKGQPDVSKIYDPWGTIIDYVCTPDDQFPELISAGRDKQFGTADDISSRGK